MPLNKETKPNQTNLLFRSSGAPPGIRAGRTLATIDSHCTRPSGLVNL